MCTSSALHTLHAGTAACAAGQSHAVQSSGTRSVCLPCVLRRAEKIRAVEEAWLLEQEKQREKDDALAAFIRTARERRGPPPPSPLSLHIHACMNTRTHAHASHTHSRQRGRQTEAHTIHIDVLNSTHIRPHRILRRWGAAVGGRRKGRAGQARSGVGVVP